MIRPTGFLAVDPGLRATGIAFIVGGKIERLALGRPTSPKAPGFLGPDLRAARETAANALRLIAPEGLLAFGPRVYAVVVEWPQIYGAKDGERRKEDPNDLLALTFINGEIAATFPETSVAAIPPRIWTDGVPKEKRQANFMAPENRQLDALERELIMAIKPAGLRHNAIDAGHLGKWAGVGDRWRSWCTFPRSS